MKIPKPVIFFWAASVVIGAAAQTWCAYSMFVLQDHFAFIQGCEIHD